MAASDKELEKLRKDLNDLKAQFKEMADEGGGVVDSARAALMAEAEKLVDSLKDVGASAAHKGEELIHSAEDKISDNPWVSVLATLGVGIVIGMMLRRR